MTKKQFFRAVNTAHLEQFGAIAGDSAISLWVMRLPADTRRRQRTDDDVAACVADVQRLAVDRAAQPKRTEFVPWAGDGFGLYREI